MTTEQMIGGIVAAVILFAVLGAIRNSITRKRTKHQAPLLPTPVQIAHLKEQIQADTSDGCLAGFLILALLGASILAAVRYFEARTVDDQIVALLIWIGNCAFWGIFIITFVLARRRVYIVYRDITPSAAERRREPNLFESGS